MKPAPPNAKISSFAAPTAEDIAVFNALDDDEKRALVHAELKKGDASEVSGCSMADIRNEALRRLAHLPDQ